jgi:cytochrome c5
VTLIASALVIMTVLVACGSGSSQPPQATPAQATPPSGETATAAPVIDAAALLQTRCTVCHSLDRVTQSRMTSEQWDQTVTLMIGKGAQLTDAEKQALVEYLAKTYGQ